MKRKLLLLLALMAIGLSNVWAFNFSAVAPSGQTLYYDITGGNAEVSFSATYFDNLTGALVIPASVTYNGATYSVTSIEDYAFRDCSGLTSVTIPNSVTSIGDAFRGCSGLTSIIVGSGNTYYDSRNNCNAIIETNTNKLIAGCKNTIIPNSVTSIGENAFYGCSGLTSVTIPNSVTSIGDGAFFGCSGLTGVTIPNSVTSISQYAFQYCSGLTSVTIPNSVTSIGSCAFCGCSGLTSVTIPNSVTSIGYAAFGQVRLVSYCGSATGSPWGGTRVGCFYEDGEFIFEDTTQTTILAYIGTGSSVSIPNSVTSIGYAAFSGCSGLTSVTIPNSVTSIGSHAFEYCSSLTSVTIPNSVTSIGDWTFYGCSGLTSVTIGNSVTSIGSSAFCGCSSLTSVTIPNSVTSIGGDAFRGCSDLTSVTIGNSVTSIGTCAFYGCSNVDTLYYNARNLTTTSEWGYSSSSYNSYGFRPMTLKHLVIGDSVQTLPNDVFYNQDSLTSVTIPNSVTTIGDFAFRFCSGLTSVTMRGTVPPTLGVSVFYGNASNRKINVPCGAYDNYYNANNGWSYYRYDLSDPIVDIDVTVNAESGKGSASIIPLRGQNVRCDSTIVVMATSNYGYHFDHWSTGGTEVQDTISIECDTVITAYFAKNQYTIVLLSDDASLGSMSGGGTFDYLDTITLTATTIAEHHHFVRWSDGNRENPRQWVVSEDMILTAYFAKDTHSVTVVSNDLTRGMVTSSGSEFEYLSPCTVTATAYTGFVFTGWSNGVTANPYTFAVQSDVELTAIFVSEDELMFTITVETDDPTMGSVSGGGMAMSGGEVTIHAVANEGYHFVRWNDNNTNADRSVTVTADVTYTAYFAANQTQGVENVETMAVVKVMSDCITIEGAEGEHVMIFDVTGRVLVNEPMAEGKRFRMPRNGVYMVKVGNHPAQKVVVIR